MTSEDQDLNQPDDRELVSKVQKGDEESFAILMQRYENMIYGLALRHMGNPEDAMEVAQDTFYKAYVSLKSFRGQSAFSTWLYAIALNTARNKLRSRGRRGYDITQSLDRDEEELPKMDPPSKDPNPSEDALAQDSLRCYKEALASLSPPFREALLLRDVEGLGYEEIAYILKTNMGTVKSRINRARESVRQFLMSRGLLEA